MEHIAPVTYLQTFLTRTIRHCMYVGFSLLKYSPWSASKSEVFIKHLTVVCYLIALSSAMVYPQLWIGLRYDNASQTYVWGDGSKLSPCDTVRLWYGTSSSANGNATPIECFSASHETEYLNYNRWVFAPTDCSAALPASICHCKQL
jgi:hypothetical protein